MNPGLDTAGLECTVMSAPQRFETAQKKTLGQQLLDLAALLKGGFPDYTNVLQLPLHAPA